MQMCKHVLTRSSNRYQIVSPLKITSTSSQTWVFYLRFVWKHRYCLKMPEFATKTCHLNSTSSLEFGLQTPFPRPEPSAAHIWKENAERGYIAQVGHKYQQLRRSFKSECVFSIKLWKNTKLQPVPEELSPFIPVLLTITSQHKGALSRDCGSDTTAIKSK